MKTVPPTLCGLLSPIILHNNRKQANLQVILQYSLLLEEVVAVKRAVSKSSRLYDNSSWDLVDADKKGKVDYKKIKKDKLPAVLKNKSETEIKSYVKEQSKKRAEIQAKINELDAKRRSFIAKKQKEGTQKDALNSVMIKAIKKQAKLKNYSW